MTNDMIKIAASLCLHSYNTAEPTANTHPFNIENISGFVLDNPDICWIVITGTNEATDWLTNMNVKKTSDGFHRGFRSSSIPVHSFAEKYIGDKPIIVTGHSMGGAIAVIVGARISAPIRDVSVITFGQPRIATILGISNIPIWLKDYTRVVNMRDPVPYTPFWLMGYKHFGKVIYLSDKGVVNPGFFDKLWEIVQAPFSSLKAGKIASRHDMSVYKSRVEQFLSQYGS